MKLTTKNLKFRTEHTEQRNSVMIDVNSYTENTVNTVLQFLLQRYTSQLVQYQTPDVTCAPHEMKRKIHMRHKYGWNADCL